MTWGHTYIISIHQRTHPPNTPPIPSRWSPYCTRNAVIRSYDGKGDLLLFFLFNLRVLRREIFLRIRIVDDSLDERRLIVMGHSVPRAFAEGEALGTRGQKGLPPQCYEDCPPMHFPCIRAMVSHPDERHVRVTIAVKLDVNTSIPRAVVDFAIRRCVVCFFAVLGCWVYRCVWIGELTLTLDHSTTPHLHTIITAASFKS